jgi:hypothetical protein
VNRRYCVTAQNLARTLTKAYDDALQFVDPLVMPTLRVKRELPEP